jgi:hypothetical protein
MGGRSGSKTGSPLRDTVLVLMLVSHLAVSLGFPLRIMHPRALKNDSRRYPCQDRPCGCLTEEECWKGDCCCFSLEEKLAWAESHGVEPPDHVRPLVELRKARLASSKKKSCCCSEAQGHEAESSKSACPCSNAGRDSRQTPCEAATPSPECNAAEELKCCPEKHVAGPSGGRWIVGLFAQECRGAGPMGLYALEPTLVPQAPSTRHSALELAGFIADTSSTLSSSSHRPPTPPPRGS